VCGCTSGQVLHHQVYLAPLELQAPDEVDIVACDRCGQCFADVPTSQITLDEGYRDHSKYADTSLHDLEATVEAQPPTDSPWDLQRLAGTAAWLAARVSPDARVLDAGCATGALIGYMQAQGFTDLVGLDPSPAATATVHRQYGVPVVTGSFLDPPSDIGSFDVVALSHVMEHLADVRGAVAGMWELTAPGGCVYIEVPDAEHYADHLVAPFNDFNTEHINHFSSSTLRTAMELAGFTTITLESKLVLCSPTDLYPAIFGLFRRPPQPAPAPQVARDDGLVESLRRYVVDSEAMLARIGADVTRRAAGRPIVVWGAGQLSMKLLAGPVGALSVSAIVDTSEAKWGQHFGSLTVIGPADVPDDDTPVLITSIHREDSIEASVRSWFPDREIIKLRG
jgi:SAM-dependent methyltransferase